MVVTGPLREVLIGLTWGVPAGGAFGLLPIWISGAPCYLVSILLWQQGVRGHRLTGFLCGSLAGAATQGLGSFVAIQALVIAWILSPVLGRTRPWIVALGFYVVSVAWSFFS